MLPFLVTLISCSVVKSVADTSSGGSSANNVPVANAGSDQTVATSNIVTMDGSASSDADGDTLSFFWMAGSSNPVTINLLSPTDVAPTFNSGNVSGNYTFLLYVNDGQVTSNPDSVVISVH